MCGILGSYEPSGVDRARCRIALEGLAHRGPDNGGEWSEPNETLYLGHRRLKILDLSDGANQPMMCPQGRYVLIYNGEIVNFREVRRNVSRDWSWKTDGDTEVLLARFTEIGLAAFDECVGMFACAIYDRKIRKLHLVRDRFGIKPLYFTRTVKGGLAFASEITVLLGFRDSVRPDEDIVRTYLETGLYDHSSRTFFDGVHSLKAGWRIELNLVTGAQKEIPWYRIEDHVEDHTGKSESELIEETMWQIDRAVTEHLTADVPVGLNVSGGVDSSALLAISRSRINDIEVFSQDYEAPYSEAKWVDQVCGDTRLHRIDLNWEKIDRMLEETVRVQAEPFGGVTVVGYYYLYQEMRNAGVVVALDGNGVDECFLGYNKYLKSLPGEGEAIDGTLGTRAKTICDRLLKRTNRISVPQVIISDDPAKSRGVADLCYSKIPRGLRFNDRMSMQASRELRVPFLDNRLVEFALGIPTHFLLNNGQGKSLFRKAVARVCGEELAFAPKRSVQSPQREWLGKEWGNKVSEVISSTSFAGRGWVDPKEAKALFEEFRSRGGDNSFFVWQWFNLELWARESFD